MVYKFLIKNLVEVVLLMNQIISSQMSLINQLLKKFKERKFYSSFRDNIWGIDLADMQSLSKYKQRNQVNGLFL